MKMGRDGVRVGYGSDDAHGPATTSADGDVHAKDSGQQCHPGQAIRRTVVQLAVV